MSLRPDSDADTVTVRKEQQRKTMKSGFIPASWLGITNSWSAEKALALLEEVNRREMEHTDLEGVKRVWDEMQEMKGYSVQAWAIEDIQAATPAEAAKAADRRYKRGVNTYEVTDKDGEFVGHYTILANGIAQEIK